MFTSGVTILHITLSALALLLVLCLITRGRPKSKRLVSFSLPSSSTLLPSLVCSKYHVSKADDQGSSGLRLPPGPPRKPIIGNAMDMPTRCEWVTYNQWAKQYGELLVVYLAKHISFGCSRRPRLYQVFGQTILFVNSVEVAQDLLEKRSKIYSDRPDFPMLML